MDELPSSDDLREFLKSLTAHEVSFLVLGGYAVALHGYPRATADFDPWVDSSAINADRVLAALRDFGFTPTEEAAQALWTPGKVLRMGHPPTRTELLTAPAGVEFGPCRARAVTRDLFGVPVPVIGLDDLIANKCAAGSPKDLIDAAELERIRSRLGRSIRRGHRFLRRPCSISLESTALAGRRRASRAFKGSRGDPARSR